MATPLWIVLQGLIALVPAEDHSNSMTALLVNATHEEHASMDCSASHSPRLNVYALDSECVAAGCPRITGGCSCDLTGQDVSFEITPKPLVTSSSLSARPRRELPFDAREAADFGYVANMGVLGYRLNKGFLAEEALPRGLSGRVRFSFDTVAACSLATRPDENVENVHPLSFRPLRSLEGGSEIIQALSQKVVTKLAIPEGSGERPAVAAKLRNVATGEVRTINLSVFAEGVVVVVSNTREELFADDPCNDGVARDFSHFYDLAENPPDIDKRPIPHVKYTRWKSSANLDPVACIIPIKPPGKDPISRPICPMATFNPF
jgi:hypothetical protein